MNRGAEPALAAPAARDLSPGDLSRATTGWSEALPFADIFLGIVPELNAVVELNPAAALAWEALRTTGSAAEAEALYAELCPARAHAARADLAACIALWVEAGLFDPPAVAVTPPAPDPEGRSWALERTVSAAGHAIGIRIEDPELAAEASFILADFPPAAAAPAERISVLAPDADGWWIVGEVQASRLVPDRLRAKSALCSRIIAAAAPDGGWSALLHGACVERGGRTILLSAAGGSGKTTLAAELAFQGWRVMAEDVVPLDRQLEAVPLPFAMSVKEGAWDLFARRSPDLLDCPVFRSGERRLRYLSLDPARRASGPSQPDLILFPRYDPSASPSLRAVPPVERLHRLLAEESWVDLGHGPAERFLAWVSRCLAFEIVYPSTSAALDLIGEASLPTKQWMTVS